MGRGAATATGRMVLVALMLSVVFAPFAYSIGCTGVAKSVSKMAGCHDNCCAQMACCSVKKSAAPVKPQPLSTTRETASQEMVNFPPPSLPQLQMFVFETGKVHFSHCEVPHNSTAPLAQSCIQLI